MVMIKCGNSIYAMQASPVSEVTPAVDWSACLKHQESKLAIYLTLFISELRFKCL